GRGGAKLRPQRLHAAADQRHREHREGALLQRPARLLLQDHLLGQRRQHAEGGSLTEASETAGGARNGRQRQEGRGVDRTADDRCEAAAGRRVEVAEAVADLPGGLEAQRRLTGAAAVEQVFLQLRVRLRLGVLEDVVAFLRRDPLGLEAQAALAVHLADDALQLEPRSQRLEDSDVLLRLVRSRLDRRRRRRGRRLGRALGKENGHGTASSGSAGGWLSALPLHSGIRCSAFQKSPRVSRYSRFRAAVPRLRWARTRASAI